MQIKLENHYVEFIPETEDEKAALDSLWQTLVDCVGFSRKLAPIGEYVPKVEGKGIARFAIENTA